MTRSWQCMSSVCSTFGKQEHLAWYVTDLFNSRRVVVRSQEILLFDDDLDNVARAIEFGHNAYHVPDGVTMSDIKEFIDTITPTSTKCIHLVHQSPTNKYAKMIENASVVASKEPLLEEEAQSHPNTDDGTEL